MTRFFILSALILLVFGIWMCWPDVYPHELWKGPGPWHCVIEGEGQPAVCCDPDRCCYSCQESWTDCPAVEPVP